MDEYNGLRINVTPRAVRSGGVVYDVKVSDGFFKPLWSHTVTTREDAVRIARKWIDGTDRSVGTSHLGE